MTSTSTPPTDGAGRHRRATIEDVAARAGVSVATVSRALRGLPNVAMSTRRRVTDVATDLNYEPDPAAARLAAGRTHTITIRVPALSSWYFSNVVAGAEAVCTEAGYEVQVMGISGHDARCRFLDEHHQLERRTDGLILVDVPVEAEQAESLRRRGIALATVGGSVPGHPSVGIDDAGVGRLAAEHLTGLGHRRIGVIGGLHNDPMDFEVPRCREKGFATALAARGLALDRDLVAGGNFGIDGGQEAMAALLDHPDPPTAVFAMSDEMAFGALMELRRRELRSGVDISLIGVDDHEFARVAGLTTIRQPVADHGAVAARLLLEAMCTDATTEPHLARVELIVRSTTGPPPNGSTESPLET